MAADSDLGAEALPNEVMTEILARLPAKSVGRFRCVSRGWSAMLSSDYFIDLHRQRANRPDHLRLLLTANGSSYDGYLYSWQPGGDGAVEKLMRDDWLQSVVPLTKPCRGLVLIRATDCGGYYVVNPCSGACSPTLNLEMEAVVLRPQHARSSSSAQLELVTGGLVLRDLPFAPCRSGTQLSS